jgi:hypothetical protein
MGPQATGKLQCTGPWLFCLHKVLNTAACVAAYLKGVFDYFCQHKLHIRDDQCDCCAAASLELDVRSSTVLLYTEGPDTRINKRTGKQWHAVSDAD